MNREIKFRAWDKKWKHLYEVTSIFPRKKAVMCSCCRYKFDEVELMQSTGLKDKNGVEIYEGDIARLPAYLTTNTEYAVCKWIDNSSSVQPVIGLGFIDLKERTVYSDEWDDFEVIGNIHENADLLKESEE